MPLPRAALAALLALAALGSLPAVAAAHSELSSSTPADGEVVVGGASAVVGEFTEPVDPGRSSMELRGPEGARIATGGVPDGGPVTRMEILGLPSLAPGTYTVRWTTVTPDDDGVERGTFSFAVEAPTPTPSPPPSPTAPSPTAEAATPSPSPTATVAPSSTPSPPPEPDPAPTAGPGDVVVPLAVLAVVLAGGAAWLLRRRR